MSASFIEVFTIFEDLTDPRVRRTLRHELMEIMVIALCATIAGSNGWTDVARFGQERLAWLRTFLTLPNGAPSHDTFGRVFARLDPAQLVTCLQQWLADLGRDIGQHIAIDGKALRGSFDTAAEQNPLHLVSAWSSEARLTLGQLACAAKSNEITAIPLLLELLDLNGATVTIDAMGCQKEIAQKLIDEGGQYVLALKDNHPKLCEAVADTFTAALEAEKPPEGLRHITTVEADHGRRERREYYALPAPPSLPGFAEWAALMTIVMVGRFVVRDGCEHCEVSYFLSSLPPRVKALARLIRGHWSIENGLHWVLDVNFTEDASRIRRGNGPQTAAMLRRLAVSILSVDTARKETLRGKRYRAALSTEALERILLSFVEN